MFSNSKKIILGALAAGIIAFAGAPGITEPLSVTSSAAELTASKLAAPTGFKAASITDTGIKLTWSKVKGADGYRVFIYNKSTKKFERYKNVSSNVCNVTDRSAGTTYTFRVAALTKNGSKYTVGTQSAKLSVKTSLPAPKNLKAEASQNSVKLTWSKVSGASAYRVYMLNSKGEYETYGNVSANSCTVKDLKSGTAYKFKVAALVKSNGSYLAQVKSDAVACTTKSASSSGTGLLDLPKFGSSSKAVIKELGLTTYQYFEGILPEVNGYIAVKEINGADTVIMLYFDTKDRFFYGAMILSPESVSSTEALAYLNNKYGKADMSMEYSGLSFSAWLNQSAMTADFIADSPENGISLYGKISMEYAPDSYKNGQSDFDPQSIFSML